MMRSTLLGMLLTVSICLPAFSATDWTADGACTAMYLMEDSSGDLAGECGDTGTFSTSNLTYQVTGKYDFATDWNGTSSRSYLQIGSNLNGTTFTAGAWIEPDDLSATRYILDSDNQTTGQRNSRLLIRSTPDCYFGIFVSNTEYSVSTTTLDADVWTHCAGIYDGDTVFIYRNGVEEDTDTSPSGNMDQDSPTNVFGFDRQRSTSTTGEGSFFDGAIDELFSFSEDKTSTDINEIMDCGLEGTQSCDGAARRIWFALNLGGGENVARN